MKNKLAEYFIIGGAWISSSEYSLLGDFRKPSFDSAEILQIPKELFTAGQVGRYGRFDAYTRAGFSAAGLAVKNAGYFAENESLRDCGIIVSSVGGSSGNDLEYYKTAAGDAALASPNLFSYTLPGIMPGECAVHFKLMGPSFCVSDGEIFGMESLISSCAMIYSDTAERMLAGSVECGGFEKNDCRQGAVFLMLAKNPETEHSVKIIYDSAARKIYKDNIEIKNITELF